MKYSFSSIEKYKACPYYFKLYYLDKIRPLEEPSPLTFGSALDKAFSAMLIPGEKTPEEVFLEEWTKEKIITPNFTWLKSDIDEDLLQETNVSSDAEKAFYSLKAKGLIMLKALKEKLMHQIECVYSTQEAILLENQDESDDKFIGFIDFIIKLKGYNKPIIGDLKTTSVKYDEDAVKKSPQLTMYTYAAGEKYKTNLAGFFVVNKKLIKTKHQTCTKCGHQEINSRAKSCTKENPKRCGGDWNVRLTFDAELSILIDEIGQAEENAVLDTIDNAHASIKAGNFEQNHQSCVHPIYRKRCPFYGLCHEGKMDGLTFSGEKK